MQGCFHIEAIMGVHDRLVLSDDHWARICEAII